MLVDQVFESEGRRDAVAIQRRLLFDNVLDRPKARRDALLRLVVDVGNSSAVIEPYGFSQRGLAEEADSQLILISVRFHRGGDRQAKARGLRLRLRLGADKSYARLDAKPWRDVDGRIDPCVVRLHGYTDTKVGGENLARTRG